MIKFNDTPIIKQAKKASSSKNKHVLVLLSGGIDSSATISFYLNQRFSVSALFCGYGHLSARKEGKAAAAICEYYDIILEKIKCTRLSQLSSGYIYGRNAFLLDIALMNYQYKTGIIAIGVHSGTPYADCSTQFIKKMQSIFDMYTEGRVGVGAPFLHWNKCNIWDYCRSEKVPIELTYSCELGKKQPCGQCLSCKDLEALYAR